VASAVSIQRELRRYSEDNGAFLMEDLEVELPVKARVDSLGQIMTEVVNEMTSGSALTRIRLRIRPDAQPVDRIPIIADAPLASLNTLSTEQVQFLEAHRIFSVEDLIRTARSVAARKVLDSVIPSAVLDDSLARGSVLLIPVIPPHVALALIKVGLRSVDEFLHRDRTQLATALTGVLGGTVSQEQVAQWQASLTRLRTLGSPSSEVLHPATTGGPVTRLAPRDPAHSI
jgi:hypothetical protein